MRGGGASGQFHGVQSVADARRSVYTCHALAAVSGRPATETTGYCTSAGSYKPQEEPG
jgi:hypothetical protein